MKTVMIVLMVMVLYTGFAFAGEKAKDGHFIAYDDGTVLDTTTNLMWAARRKGRIMKTKDNDGIKWAILFFVAVLSVSIVLGLLCNIAYKIF